MNRDHINAMVYKVSKEIILLKEDLSHVKDRGIKRTIENDINQKQARLHLMMERARVPPQKVIQKTLDKETRSAVR